MHTVRGGPRKKLQKAAHDASASDENEGYPHQFHPTGNNNICFQKKHKNKIHQ